MSVHVPLLIFGLLLLWLPRQWMRAGLIIGARRHRSHGTGESWKPRQPADRRLSYGEFTKVRNYVDLLRGAAGGLAIVGGWLIEPALYAAEATDREALRSILVAKLAILLVGLLIQTIRYERHHLRFFAPIFFIAGLSVALCGPWPALFALLLVWAVNPMFGSPEGFLTVYAVVLVGFGVLFRETPRALAIAAGVLCFVPVLLSLLTRRPLVVFSRRAASNSSG